MLLKIKDFIWTQNEEYVFINIPLKGKKKKDVDILLTDAYAKVNFNPYIFECFLFNVIDDVNSKVVFNEGMLLFSLKKLSPISWTSLNNETYDDKEKAMSARLQEIEKFQSKLNNTEKENAEKKSEGNKYSLREMMQLENQERERISNYKESETRKALDDLEEWEKCQIAFSRGSETKVVALPAQKPVGMPQKEKRQTQIVPAMRQTSTSEVRKPCRIEVSFTPRVFPTPERESVKQQEDEWLSKQLAHKQHHSNTVTADMKPEENNPDWLRAKGNSLFAAGDYEGALAAYSLGIELNPNLFELYSNRAACHIKVRNFFRAVEDASSALDLLVPPVPLNRLARVRAHLRRGAAFCQLEMLREGLLDYEAALRIDPDNEAIREDIARLSSSTQLVSQ